MYPPVRSFQVAATGMLVSGRSIVCGYSIRETAGAVANVRLWDNSVAAAGQLLLPIHVEANLSRDSLPTGHGLVAEQGVFAEIVAGTVELVVYIVPETEIPGGFAVFNDWIDNLSVRKLARLVNELES